jgi:hypothetical protein
MLQSTLALAMGLLFLVVARLTGNPSAYGLVVFVGFVFVAIGCAMHLDAVIDRVFGSAAEPWRVSAKVAGWLAVGAGTAWLIGRTPSEEVLLALVLAPPAVGVAGLVVARDHRWPAVAFLGVAGMLIVLIASVWLARQTA